MLFRCNRGKRIIVDDSLTRKDVKDGMLLPDANKYKKKNKCFKCGRIKLQMTSIAGRMYCCECSSELIEKVSFFREAREMAEGLSKEQLIGYYMAELETCCECEEKLKVSEKTNTKIMDYVVDLEKQLAEKEKDKISFALKQFKKLKKSLRDKVCLMKNDEHCYPQNAIHWQDVVAIIGNQIKELTHQPEDKGE